MNTYSNTVTHLPTACCPTCGAKIDAASPTQCASGPEPGDVSICFYCTAFLEFNEDMIPELMSEGTQESLKPDTLAELMRIREAIKGFKQADLH